jgi:hypothetical protein
MDLLMSVKLVRDSAILSQWNGDFDAIHLVCIWYHSGNVIFTVIHRDFTEITLCSFYKIMVNHCDSGIPRGRAIGQHVRTLSRAPVKKFSILGINFRHN